MRKRSLTVTFGGLWKTFGTSGILLSFFIIAACALVGIFDMRISVLFGLAGVILCHLFGTLHLGWGALTFAIIMGGVLLFKLGRT